MKSLPSAARQARIRERFANQPGASISELAREFDVSEMTIRRDLTALEAKTHIQRTHGGAVLTERMMLEFDYRDRREQNRAAKCAIAATARRLVQPGQRLILDTGTTLIAANSADEKHNSNAARRKRMIRSQINRFITAPIRCNPSARESPVLRTIHRCAVGFMSVRLQHSSLRSGSPPGKGLSNL